MPKVQPTVGGQVFLEKAGLASLVSELSGQGYRVLAPTLRDGVILLRPVRSVADMARAVKDRQDGGMYRLSDGDPDLFFEFVLGPDGPKRYLFPPEQRLFALHVEAEQFVLDAGPDQPQKIAFLGIRPCELAAIQVQDRVFGADDPTPIRCEAETGYRQAREAALTVAVNCTHPGGTCFCTSMGTGPSAQSGFDLALTELRGGFVVHVGTPRGGELAARLPVREATSSEQELAEVRLEQARGRMGRTMDTSGLRQLLCDTVDNPHWDDVAKRCLGCGNCTMVCPTCFCSSMVDGSGLADGSALRKRLWDSCFTLQFSYTTAGPVRSSGRARYRHWLRHKLGTWWEQFGLSGCVGCGRCITWCPVGIDLTREVESLRGHDGASAQVRGQQDGGTR
jgi:sulfhydrogenase subunit beta (sulfur reductase)